MDLDLERALNYSWEVVLFKDYDLLIQVYFDNPILFSQTVQNQDVLQIDLVDLEFWKGVDFSVCNPNITTVYQRIPRQSLNDSTSL